MNTKDEILENYIKILAADGADMSPDEYAELMKGNYRASGESSVEEDYSPLFDWNPEPEPVLLTNRKPPSPIDEASGAPPRYNSTSKNPSSGDVNWNLGEETDPESDVGYKYHPDAKPYRGPRNVNDPFKGKYKKKKKKKPDIAEEESAPDIVEEEIAKELTDAPEVEVPGSDPVDVESDSMADRMSDKELAAEIVKDPVNLVTNLMIQRDPRYSDPGIIYTLLESLFAWLKDSNIKLDKGSVLYEESQYMIDFLKKELDKKAEE